MAHRYPTRQYSYRGRSSGLALEGVSADPIELDPSKVYRFVLGRDAQPIEVVRERDLAKDPFAALVLGRGASPKTLVDLLGALGAELPSQRTFVVGDGSQIPWTPATRDVERALRLLVTRSASRDEQPSLMISTAPELDDAQTFLQVIAWDEVAGAYQFYDRRGAWVWAGSSWEAFEPDSRGNGPFDSHVNGALNMKELKAPWMHWHSQSARVEDDVLPPEAAIRSHPVWADRAPANELELQVVRPGIERWTASRFSKRTQAGRIMRFEELFRQVVDTTTVNIASSPQESAVVVAGKALTVPITFIIDRDALFDVLELAPDIDVPRVEGALYKQTMDAFHVHTTDGTTRFPGDTHFAFAVPERAFEDVVVVRELVARNVVSAKLMAAILMVDFSNPVFSERRKRLGAYAPSAPLVGDADGFEAAFLGAIRASGAATPGSPEAELVENIAIPDGQWRSVFEQRIEALFSALGPRWNDPAGFADLFRLAESRRRSFRGFDLAEFKLTLPRSDASDDPLRELSARGEVRFVP